MEIATVYKLEAPYKLAKEEESLFIDKLGDFQLYARTEYTVISKGTELAAWQGQPPLREGKSYPRLLGYCNLAKVVRVGSQVNTIFPGDYILTHQSHRSAFICSLNEVLVTIKDTDSELRKKITTSYLYYLAYNSLLVGGFRPGYRVCVIGLGILGIAVATLVNLFGCDPIIFSDQAYQNNAIQNLKHIRSSWIHPKDLNTIEKVLSCYGINGTDLVVNTSNKWPDHLLALKTAKVGGEIVCLGFPGRDETAIPFNPLDPKLFYGKNLTIKHCGYPKGLSITDTEDFLSTKRGMKYIVQLIRSGKLEVNSIISFETSSDNLDFVYRKLQTEQNGLLTALIKW